MLDPTEKRGSGRILTPRSYLFPELPWVLGCAPPPVQWPLTRHHNTRCGHCIYMVTQYGGWGGVLDKTGCWMGGGACIPLLQDRQNIINDHDLERQESHLAAVMRPARKWYHCSDCGTHSQASFSVASRAPRLCFAPADRRRRVMTQCHPKPNPNPEPPQP